MADVMNHPPFNVLFLCTHNSARSIMGEAILTKLGGDKFRAFSAGSHPRGEPNPLTIETLLAHDYDVSFARSKTWDEFAEPDAPVMDFIFTVCDDAAGEECPVWPGHPMTAHWGIPDPSAVVGEELIRRRAFEDAYRMLERRISVFVSLPVRSLDKIALRNRLREIGAMEGATQKAVRESSAA